MSTKKKQTDKKTDPERETESESEENNENGEEHKDLESDTREALVDFYKGPGHHPNPWDPGPGKSTAV
jgi:hypothetical protein